MYSVHLVLKHVKEGEPVIDAETLNISDGFCWEDVESARKHFGNLYQLYMNMMRELYPEQYKKLGEERSRKFNS